MKKKPQPRKPKPSVAQRDAKRIAAATFKLSPSGREVACYTSKRAGFIIDCGKETEAVKALVVLRSRLFLKIIRAIERNNQPGGRWPKARRAAQNARTVKRNG